MFPIAYAGITPAYAGTTGYERNRCTFLGDHPRLRGNYVKPALEKVKPKGSPPLTRELRYIKSTYAPRNRITPAYTGTTFSTSLKLKRQQDHPRLRGNYLTLWGKMLSVLGSPPLTRELPTSNGYVVNHFGITPAYAGTTK